MVPWLSIWLLACNGSSYLTDSIEAVLDQSYEDSELIISDYYPSTDSTPGTYHRRQRRDSWIRYVHKPRNADLVQGHAFVIGNARGELLKWASQDALSARALLKRCIHGLERDELYVPRLRKLPVASDRTRISRI